MKSFRERFTDFFTTPPPITENSTLQEIAVQHPEMDDFIERKYGLRVGTSDRTLPLKDFVQKHHLPPAQILFMEIQLHGRFKGINEISCMDAKKLLDQDSTVCVLDVREDWELKHGKLPGGQPLTPALLDGLLNQENRDQPILLYCHFGVRSLDAATFFSDRGFTNVHCLKGGIDAWAQQIDLSLPRYTGSYC